jgi:hypothetical protein
MRQLTLATANFEKHGKLTRRAAFLAEMERVVPWREMCAVVARPCSRITCLPTGSAGPAKGTAVSPVLCW